MGSCPSGPRYNIHALQVWGAIAGSHWITSHLVLTANLIGTWNDRSFANQAWYLPMQREIY